MRTHVCLALLLGIAAPSTLGAERSLPEPRLTFLDNGEVRIGMDLSLGGAVTFLEAKARPGNLINSADLGRQIQMSHYSGPWPFVSGSKQPNKAWAGLGWNPIQTGDCYLNPSRVVEHRNDGRELYIKCIPMQWPLEDVPGDCVFETWTTLDGPVVHMRYRCTNDRADKTYYRPCPQELPAVYTISKLWRLMAYTGETPFANAPLTHVTNDWHQPWPWKRFIATERWAALVGSDDWGLGVFKDDGGEFHGGIHGDGRSDDPKHGSTAYVAPIHTENFDHNIVYDHRTEFLVGTLTEIRRRFNEMATRTPPSWRFDTDRQHWTLRDATDQGFPMKGEWRIKFGAAKPRLESPIQCWRADGAPGLHVEIAYSGKSTSARVFWRRLDADAFSPARSVALNLVPDGQFHSYHLDLASSAEYRGLISGLAIEPVSAPRPGEELAIRVIRLTAAKESPGSGFGPADSDVDFLTTKSRTLLTGCEVKADDGTVLYTPDGKGNYRALWTRDFAYMVENAGDLLPQARVEAALRYLIKGIRADGAAPDRVRPDGVAVYVAGGEDNPIGQPNIDNAQFLVIAADEHLKRLAPEARAQRSREWAAPLGRAMDYIPRSTTGLVFNDPQRPHSPYGFTDTVGKTGELLFESLLYWTASRRLSEWEESSGDQGQAAEYRRRAVLIEANLARLWDENTGAFLAATVDCRQVDIWGNAYALWLDFPLGERRERMLNFLVAQRERFVWCGQVRHLLRGEHWQRLLTPVAPERYQNGAYWSTASGWMMWALAQKDPALGQMVWRDLIADFRAHGVFECVNEGYRQLDSYVVSATNPLAAARRLGY